MRSTPGRARNADGGRSRLTIRTDLPSARRAAARATCEPIESPSGRACEVRRKLERARIASRIWARMSMAAAGTTAALLIARPGATSGIEPAVAGRPRVGRLRCGRRLAVARGRLRRGLDLLEQRLDALLAGNRFVELEGQLRRPPQADPGGDALPQERLGALERLGGGAPCRLVAERRVVGARHLQIGADL